MWNVVAEFTGDIAKGLVQTVGCAMAALGVTMIGAKAVDGVCRNPGASSKILVQSILGMALAEAIAFSALFFS
jgi:F-type H+-transporting ATPase subunit c